MEQKKETQHHFMALYYNFVFTDFPFKRFPGALG